MKPLSIVGLTLLAGFALAGEAHTSHDPSGTPLDEDFVTGTAISDTQCGPIPGCFHLEFTFDAHSGPSGEEPAGTVRIVIKTASGGTGTFDTASVTCLEVSGNQATIGTRSQAGINRGYVFAVEDFGGAGLDSVTVLLDEAPSVCPPDPQAFPVPLFAGDITVHDAVPFPTSKAQCAKQGWKGFGFKNRGQCVAFVARGPSSQPLDCGSNSEAAA